MSESVSPVLAQQHMLARVANALGPDILGKVAFVGGCSTALLVTDDLSLTEIRHTEDVDVIVHVMGYGKWAEFEGVLSGLGFRPSLIEDGPICRKILRDDEPTDLVVDFMPDDPSILSFSNRWYADALASAVTIRLHSGHEIRVVTAPYFVGTKLEAYKGRGGGDVLASRDVEDLLSLIEGRPALLEEIRVSSSDLQVYIAQGLQDLRSEERFDYAVQSFTRNSGARETLVHQRLDQIIG